MKMKNVGIKCDECGKYFLAGSRPDGLPNGIGFVMDDGSTHNICADCLTEKGKAPLEMGMTPRRMRALLNATDKKLKELMTEKEYKAFAKETARQMFLAEVMDCPDEDFKEFVLKNFEEIMEGGDALYDAMKEMQKGKDEE